MPITAAHLTLKHALRQRGYREKEPLEKGRPKWHGHLEATTHWSHLDSTPKRRNAQVASWSATPRYRWSRHVKPLIRKLYREMGGPDEIHINTYLDHPQGDHRTLTSFDVWGPGRRGDRIGKAKGDRVRRLVFQFHNDPGMPTIVWAIWQRQRFGIENDYKPRDFGDTPFEFHEDHVHCTFLRR